MPALWNSGPGDSSLYLQQEVGEMEELLNPGGIHRVLLSFNPPFSLILLNPNGNRADKKGNNKVLDREVNHKLSRGT